MRIGNVIPKPYSEPGGGLVVARWLHDFLSEKNYFIEEITCETHPLDNNPYYFSLFGEALRYKRLSDIMKSSEGNYDKYILHAPCGKSNMEGITIFHNNIFDYAKNRYGKLHPNYYKLLLVNGSFERASAQGPRVNVAVSNYQAECLRLHGVRIDQVIYNPISIDHYNNLYNPELVRDELGLPSDRRIISMVGNFISLKGWRWFCQLADMFPEMLFVAIGPTSKQLSTSIKNIVATGYIPREIVHKYQMASDFTLVLSSSETGPLALQESMALGVPFVSTRVGICYDLEEYSTIFSEVISDLSLDSIYRCLKRLVSSDVLQGEVKELGKEFIAKMCSPEKAGDKYRELLELHA